ncbi:MAG: terminase small subunit [Clostridia bacterium]|nr:terminase small subunit [Clostridia bacterium]
MAKGRLTKMEKVFCQLYIERNYNGTRAAVEAGYSENNAASIASHMLKKPKIIAEIARLEKEICQAVGLTPELIGGRIELEYLDACKTKRSNAKFKAIDRMISVYKLQQQFGTADSKIEISVIVDED